MGASTIVYLMVVVVAFLVQVNGSESASLHYATISPIVTTARTPTPKHERIHHPPLAVLRAMYPSTTTAQALNDVIAYDSNVPPEMILPRRVPMVSNKHYDMKTTTEKYIPRFTFANLIERAKRRRYPIRKLTVTPPPTLARITTTENPFTVHFDFQTESEMIVTRNVTSTRVVTGFPDEETSTETTTAKQQQTTTMVAFEERERYPKKIDTDSDWIDVSSGQYSEIHPGQYLEQHPGQYHEVHPGQYHEIHPGQYHEVHPGQYHENSNPSHLKVRVQNTPDRKIYNVQSKVNEFIIGEYGSISKESGETLRGVRYTAVDKSVDPSLIYETFIKFFNF